MLYRRLAAAAAVAVLALTVGWTGLLLDNAFVFRPMPRQRFLENLDASVERGWSWVSRNSREITIDAPNIYLLLMVADMGTLSERPRSEVLIDEYLAHSRPHPLRRVLVPGEQFDPQLIARWASDQDYKRWILAALAPEYVQLDPADRSAMLSPDRHHWGSLTHQLFALYHHRRFRGASAEIDGLMQHLCGRIATEANWDPRVTDLYIQRVAFLLAAGCVEQVRPRWVERIIGYQQADGGWLNAWHGWGPLPWRFYFHTTYPDQHATLQAMWALKMIRFRYPEWIDRHYPDGSG